MRDHFLTDRLITLLVFLTPKRCTRRYLKKTEAIDSGVSCDKLSVAEDADYPSIHPSMHVCGLSDVSDLEIACRIERTAAVAWSLVPSHVVLRAQRAKKKLFALLALQSGLQYSCQMEAKKKIRTPHSPT